MLSSKGNLLCQSSGVFAWVSISSQSSLHYVPFEHHKSRFNYHYFQPLERMFKISQTSSAWHVAMACFFLDSLLQPPFTFTAPCLSARQHSPCPRIELENIQLVQSIATNSWILDPSSLPNNSNSDITQTVFFEYLQCITGPKCLSILNCWTFLSSSTWHVWNLLAQADFITNAHTKVYSNLHSVSHDFTTAACSEIPAMVSQGPAISTKTQDMMTYYTEFLCTSEGIGTIQIYWNHQVWGQLHSQIISNNHT